MPVYQYEGQHYDLPDGLTNEQAISKIEAHLGKSPKQTSPSLLDSFVSGAKGTAAAAADIASGFVKLPAQAALAVGGKVADPSQSLQSSWESAGQAMEDTFPSFGKDMQGNLGYKAPMAPFEAYGKVAEYAAEKASMGNPDVQGAINIGANFLPIPFAGKAGRGLGKIAETIDPGLRKGTAPTKGPDTGGLASKLVPQEEVAPALDPQAEFYRQEALKKAHTARLQEQIDNIKRGQQPISVDSAGNAMTEGTPAPYRPFTGETPQGSAIERMTQQLGGELPKQEAPRSAMSDMATTLQEASTKEQRAAQEALDVRQRELELAVKRQQALDAGASERTRQAAASAVSEAHKALVEAQEAKRIAADTERMRNATQPEMFEGYDHGYGPNPFEATPADWRVDENGMPIRADLSMEAANLENPLQRNLWGDELAQKHEQENPVSLTAAIDRMSKEQARDNGKFVQGTPQSRAVSRLTGNPPLGSAARRALMKKQGGQLLIGERKKSPVEIKKTKEGHEAWLGDKLVGYLKSNLTGEQSKMLGENANVDIVKVAPEVKGTGVGSALYDAWSKEHGGSIAPSGKTSKEAWALWKNKYPEKVTDFVNQEAARIRQGAPRDQVLGNVTDPQVAQRISDAASNYKVGGNQSGKLLMRFGKDKEQGTLKGIPGLKDKIGDLMPDQRPVEQFLKEEAGASDVEQNLFQRVANYGTKGSLYQAIKTQNPLVKRVGETIRNANNKARAVIAEVVHGQLTPAAQALSKAERTDIMMAMQLAEANQRPLTADMLREHGFNDKQIKFFNTHTETMKLALDKINEASAIAGEAPVTPRVAYLASRASGDFRRLIYKEVDGEKSPVAILGADTRGKLDADVKRLQAEHPEWIVGDEQFFGGGSRKANGDGYKQAIELLAQNNPDVKLLADHINDILTKDAYDYMNAKSHTMEKKGIAGMSGRKLFTDAETNAKEAMQAQINYAEKVIQWAEMSKAVDGLKPLLANDNGLNMPNAKQWSKDYIQQALGNNPSAAGRAIDSAFAELGKRAGIGPSVGGKIVSASRKITNGLLLGFGNIGFLGANLIQPFKTSPEMFAFLKGRGLEKSFDAGTGYRYVGNALINAWKDLAGKEVPAHIRGALDFAKENHVYSSDLFDSSNSATKDFWHYWDKGTQFGASTVEMRTRQAAYLSYVDILHENGLTAKDGLYEVAQNLTDLQMNNYASSEAPKMYNDLGAAGGPAYNLMSYKHNEYSRLAMLANEIGRNKTASPLAVNLMSSIAFAGIVGTIGYTEADQLVKFLSKEVFKQPTSLTKILLENPNISDGIKYGGFANIGLDASSRLGTGALVPQHAIDAIMPGAGKLATAAGAIGTAIISPSEYNTKNAIRETAPNSVGGLLDRAWFSGQDSRGNELAINRNKGTPTATRNETDKALKTMGMTGIHEAKQKSLNYENDSITRAYTDIRKSLVDKATKEYFTNGRIPADFARKYIAAQGNPDSIEREITGIMSEQKMDAQTAAKLRSSMSNSVTSIHKLLRIVGKE